MRCQGKCACKSEAPVYLRSACKYEVLWENSNTFWLLWSAKSKKSHIFIVKLYFHCYAQYTLQVLNFNCLLLLYLHCSCIFSLQPNISIASLYFYCMHYRYVLQTHICIASAYFHCKWIFLLLAHIFIAFAYFCCNLVEIFPTLCEKFLTLLEKFLTVWRYVKPGKQNKVIVKTRLLLCFNVNIKLSKWKW